MARCRLCTSNDDDAVIEHLAEKMWDSRMDYFEERTPWSKAGGTWQSAFAKWRSQLARRSLNGS
jgi:hypothetical protein